MFMLMLVTPVSLYGIEESLTKAIRISCHILFMLMLLTPVSLNCIEESLTKSNKNKESSYYVYAYVGNPSQSLWYQRKSNKSNKNK